MAGRKHARECVAIAAGEVERVLLHSRAKKPKFITPLERATVGRVGGVAAGRRRFELFWENIARIEATYLTLSKQQRHIIEEFVRASLVKLVGLENYEQNPMYYMNLAKKKNRQSLSIVITPRRFGKTTATAIYVGALLLTIPNVVVAIFSTGRRASTLLLQKIAQIVVGAKQDKKDILQSNQETLKIRGESIQVCVFCFYLCVFHGFVMMHGGRRMSAPATATRPTWPRSRESAATLASWRRVARGRVFLFFITVATEAYPTTARRNLRAATPPCGRRWSSRCSASTARASWPFPRRSARTTGTRS